MYTTDNDNNNSNNNNTNRNSNNDNNINISININITINNNIEWTPLQTRPAMDLMTSVNSEDKANGIFRFRDFPSRPFNPDAYIIFIDTRYPELFIFGQRLSVKHNWHIDKASIFVLHEHIQMRISTFAHFKSEIYTTYW